MTLPNFSTERRINLRGFIDFQKKKPEPYTIVEITDASKTVDGVWADFNFYAFYVPHEYMFYAVPSLSKVTAACVSYWKPMTQSGLKFIKGLAIERV